MKKWLIGIILVVLGVVAWYVFSVSRAPVEEAPAPAPIVAEPIEPQQPAEAPYVPEDTVVAPPATVVEETPLPPLADSDPLVIDTLSGLVGEEPVRRFVVSEQVVSRLVATLDALGGKQVPGSIRAVEGPGGELQATANDDPESVILNAMGDAVPQFVLDPVNYQRYAPYVDMVDAMDAAEVVAAYRSQRPLFEDAFRQLGYPDGDFDQRLRVLLDQLLATPDIPGPVRLIKPEAYYLFADKDLESLTAGQKILIRMGPDNAARVKAKLTEIRAALQ